MMATSTHLDKLALIRYELSSIAIKAAEFQYHMYGQDEGGLANALCVHGKVLLSLRSRSSCLCSLAGVH